MEPEKSIEDDKVFWLDDLSWFTLGFSCWIIPKIVFWYLDFLAVFELLDMFYEQICLERFRGIKILELFSLKLYIEMFWKLCIRVIVHIVGDSINPICSKSFDDFFSEIAFSRTASANEINEIHSL